MGDDSQEPEDFSSSPCAMREFSCFFFGPEPRSEALAPQQVKVWRKQERQRLIAERLKIQSSQRTVFNQAVAGHIDVVLSASNPKIIAVFWPFRGEPNLLPWMKERQETGAIWALPVVAVPKSPLAFKSWHPGDKLIPGIWDIPVPLNGTLVVPDVIIAPVVGFDRSCFRLGYGGGYYDRTLAQFERKPLTLGVGFGHAFIPTIHPQPFDIPMDYILTEQGIYKRP